jgi:hypothetical protein
VLAAGDLLATGAKSDPLHLGVLAAPFPVDLGLAQVPVILEIPFGAEDRSDAGPSVFQIYAYAANGQGTLTDYLTQEMSIDVMRLRSSGSRGIKFYGTLLLPPGDYELRVLVHSAARDASSVSVTSLHVPVAPGGPATVLSPFFESSATGWTMTKGPVRSGTALEKADYPFSVASQSFVPAAAATLANGSDARVALITYNFGQGVVPAPLQVRSEVLDRSGETHPVDQKILERSDGERWGGRKLVLAVRPETLPPGDYRLRVTVSDPASLAAAEATSAFEVK